MKANLYKGINIDTKEWSYYLLIENSDINCHPLAKPITTDPLSPANEEIIRGNGLCFDRLSQYCAEENIYDIYSENLPTLQRIYQQSDRIVLTQISDVAREVFDVSYIKAIQIHLK